jgi:hypothetical protein
MDKSSRQQKQRASQAKERQSSAQQASHKEIGVAGRNQESDRTEERRSALLIANSRYDNKTLNKLRSPNEDVDALDRVLKDRTLGNFGNVLILRDAEAHTIANQIEAFFLDSLRSDLLLLYFSGHGIKDDEGYLRLAASNTSLTLLDSTTVSTESLNKYMRKSPSQRKVLILDCCFGGAFAKGMMPKRGAESVDTKEHFQGSGSVVLTASDSMQYSFEGEVLHGRPSRSIFTDTLIEGIESGEADENKDGRITVVDAYQYAEKALTRRGSSQRPRMHAFDLSGEIFLSHAKSPQRLPEEYSAITHSRLSLVRMLGAGYMGKLIDEEGELSKPAFKSLLQLRQDSDRDVAELAERIHKSPKLGHSVYVAEGIQQNSSTRSSRETTRSIARRTPRTRDRNKVFLNLPYTQSFAELYLAYIAGITTFELIPTTTLSTSGRVARLEGVLETISRCGYSLHDVTSQPGWNRALELGITIGIARMGQAHNWFVLNKDRYRTQKELSDLNGVDVLVHGGTVTGVLRALMNIFTHERKQPTIHDLTSRYKRLKRLLPQLTRDAGGNVFDPRVFGDLTTAGLMLDR